MTKQQIANMPIERYQTDSSEMAEILNYNRQYLVTLAKAGKVPAKKRFRQWLFCKEEVLTFLNVQTEEAITEESNQDVTNSASDLLQ